jgi:hypothetical protein
MFIKRTRNDRSAPDVTPRRASIAGRRRWPDRLATLLLACAVVLLSTAATAQESNTGSPQAAASDELNVNWLYGAYVPKDVPLEPLTPAKRGRLYVRQTFLTSGVYAKTLAFAIADQLHNAPPEWDGGFEAYGKRLASRYGQFAIQNTFAAAGNALLRYEPRYDRCRCSGTWPRVRHALVRNFVTYNNTERERRPQIGLYGGAMIAGLISSTWKPGEPSAWMEAYSSVVTQVAFGSFANVIGEFAPEIRGLIKRQPKP